MVRAVSGSTRCDVVEGITGFTWRAEVDLYMDPASMVVWGCTWIHRVWFGGVVVYLDPPGFCVVMLWYTWIPLM